MSVDQDRYDSMREWAKWNIEEKHQWARKAIGLNESLLRARLLAAVGFAVAAGLGFWIYSLKAGGCA